jgi:hypothetical protein
METSSYLNAPVRSLPTAAREYANAKVVMRELEPYTWHAHTLTARERLERNNRVVGLMARDAARLCRA